MSQELSEVQLDAVKLKKMLEKRDEYKTVLKKLEETPNFNEKVLLLEEILKQHDLIPNFEKFKEKKSQEVSDNRESSNKFYEKRKFVYSLVIYNKRFDLISSGSL
jgi:hypothetical protein